MIVYRKATINDAERLANIRSIFLMEANDIGTDIEREDMEAANRLYFKNTLMNDSFVAWLALDGDKIVGTSGLSFSFIPPSNKCPDGKAAYIMNMFTFPDYRKQGIAMELLKRIIEEAKSRGCKKITINATEMGKPLYERYGFKEDISAMVFCDGGI